jgi:hypothetical protein
VTVGTLNPTVSTMNHQFGLLITADLPPVINCFLLIWEVCGRPFCAASSKVPTA